MKKLMFGIIAAIVLVLGVHKAMAQFVPQAQLPRCSAPDVFTCVYDNIVSLTACKCVNPTTNAIISDSVYDNAQVNSIVNQEQTEDGLVNAVANAA